MNEIQSVKITDENYPALLKKIKDAPKVLYYIGALPTDDEKCVAVVGTRRPSSYGQQAALQIAGELADSGLTIVSGLAPGIDTCAHKICVEKKRRTIAVLGTGLAEKSIYPAENIGLARKIVEHGGCLISELPPETHGSIYSFPRRNRIISALSLGVLVVEAKEKSGSLITAEYAKKQQKKLFAVPGPIYSLNSAGPNKLIQQGALLVKDADDILKAIGIENNIRQEKTVAKNPQEQLILAALAEENLAVDKIIEKTKLTAPQVSAALALMEISGMIRNLGGNRYSLH